MCGRYYIEPGDGQLQQIIAEAEREMSGDRSDAVMKLGEVFPTNIVPVVAARGPTPMKWGYAGYKNRVINARSETAFEKPMFRRTLMERRCLIPASGYYEWRRTESGAKSKQKYALFRPDRPLYMAGLWREEQGEALPVFVILTREAAQGIRQIHHRMPVILPEEARLGWIFDGDPGRMMAQALEDVQYRPVE